MSRGRKIGGTTKFRDYRQLSTIFTPTRKTSTGVFTKWQLSIFYKKIYLLFVNIFNDLFLESSAVAIYIIVT